MGMFKKKPVVIEAQQWDGSLEEIRRLPNVRGVGFTGLTTKEGRVKQECIPALKGAHTVSPMRWITRGVKGEFYLCRLDVFEITSEASK
jgi:hypothetical protein